MSVEDVEEKMSKKVKLEFCQTRRLIKLNWNRIAGLPGRRKLTGVSKWPGRPHGSLSGYQRPTALAEFQKKFPSEELKADCCTELLHCAIAQRENIHLTIKNRQYAGRTET